MGRARGTNAGGGQSSLGYLFGGGDEVPKPAAENPESVDDTPQSPAVKENKAAAGIRGGGCCQTNNYFRSEGQNCGNFVTDRPSTKVHAAPGGNSSLGYLFGGSGTENKSNP